jgi:hypothetical protein
MQCTGFAIAESAFVTLATYLDFPTSESLNSWRVNRFTRNRIALVKGGTRIPEVQVGSVGIELTTEGL